MDNGLLDEHQQDYYTEHFGGAILTCDECKKLQSVDTNTKTKRCSHRLNRWAPWQTSCQPTVLFGHSSRTHRFCRLMESSDNFHTDSNVQENEKKLAKCLRRSDLATNDNKKLQTKPNKKLPAAVKLTGKDFRKNFLTKQTYRDSSDSDFDDKHTAIRTPIAKLSKAEEADLKPCSLEKLIAKVERDSTGKSSNKRVRLTKLPKIEKIDLDVSDIQDNQLDFCSQVTMPTLFNRCQVKRKRDSLQALYGDNFDEEEEEEKEESPPCQPSVKRARYDEPKPVEPKPVDTESGYDDEDFEFPDNFEQQDQTDTNNIDTLYGASGNFDEPKKDLLDELNNVNNGDNVHEHDNIETQVFLPFSTPPNLKNKHSTVLETIPTEDTVPEAPIDIDLSSFLFDNSPGEEEYQKEVVIDENLLNPKLGNHAKETFAKENCTFNNVGKQQSKIGDDKNDLLLKKDNLNGDKNIDGDGDMNLMGDSLLNLFDDDDDFMNDLPQSPTMVSQVTAKEVPDNKQKITDDFFSSPPIVTKTKKNTSFPSELVQQDVVDSPLFAKPKNKSRKNCIMDSQPSPAPLLKSPILVCGNEDADSNRSETEDFFVPPKSKSLFKFKFKANIHKGGRS